MEKLNVELEIIKQNKPSTRRPTIAILEAVDYAEPSGGHLDLEASSMNYKMEMQARNAEMYQAWSKTMLLPRWDNFFCYAVEMPEFPDRLQTWETVTEPFGLSKAETSILSKVGERCSTDDLIARNKARLLRSLYSKEAITIVGDTLIVNPAIVVGRHWWSPFMLGVFLIEWQEGLILKPTVNNTEKYDRYSLYAGLEWGLREVMCSHQSAVGLCKHTSKAVWCSKSAYIRGETPIGSLRNNQHQLL